MKEMVDVLNCSMIEQLYVVVIPSILLYAFFFYCILRKNPVISKNVLRTWALVVFIAGFVLYAIGFSHEGTGKSLLAIILRSIMSSLELFVSHSDLLEVSRDCVESPVYMTIFATVQFNALFVSAAMIFSIVYNRAISNIISVVELFRKRPVRNLYVFWGLSDKATILIDSVYKHPSFDKRKDVIAVINLPSSGKKASGRLNFSRIFTSTDYDIEKLSKISHIHAAILYSSHPEEKRPGKNMLEVYGLTRLRHLIAKSTNIKAFFMDDNERGNIATAEMFVEDNSISKIQQKESTTLKVYCLATRNKVNLIQEKMLNMKHVDLTLIDSAYLAALSLKVATKYYKEICPTQVYKPQHNIRIIDREYANHPINFVEHKNGYVTSAFTSMIVGFGGTGANVLNFLYEFGSFADSEKRKSTFKCYLFDDKIDSLWTDYVQQVPYFDTEESSTEIERHCCSTHSKEFWNVLNRILDDLNYVVIALGNDNDSMSFLGDLFDVVQKRRKNGFDKFHIVIRSYSVENEPLLIKTIRTYNDLIGDEVIRYFGMPSNIFTIGKIDDEELAQLSKYLKDTYEGCKKKNEKKNEKKDVDVQAVVQQNKPTPQPFEKEYEFLSIRRKDFANKEQGLHTYTKKILLGDNPDADTIEYVSVCEHIRWNASHYVQGYLPMRKDVLDRMPIKNGEKVSCSEKYKQHLCLIPFEELSKTYQDYDRAFVNDVIKLFKQNG